MRMFSFLKWCRLLLLIWSTIPYFVSSQIIFGTSPQVYPPVCIQAQESSDGATGSSSGVVALGLCDYDGSTTTSTNGKVIFFYGTDGFIRTGSPTSDKCIGPSTNDFSGGNENNPNYFIVGDCIGDHMRFVITSYDRRIQSIVDPDYCVVALPTKEGYINQDDRIALQDCTNVRDPWRPSSWNTDRRSWPVFIAIYSETFLAGDHVVISYILPFSTFENNIGDYNITIVPQGEDLATADAVYEVPACPITLYPGQQGCRNNNTNQTIFTAGNITLNKGTIAFDIAGDFVAIVRVGQIVYASSSPFTLESKAPTVSPAPSISSKPSFRPSASSAPSQEPSMLPTFAKQYCDDVTVEKAFTELGSLIPGIIISVVAVAPAFLYIRQNRTGCKFLMDVILDIAEKIYTITTVIATLNTCLFDSKGARDGDSYRTFTNAMILGVLVLVEFIVGVLGYFCCAEPNSAEKVEFDSGKFIFAERWCNGWALACLLLGGCGLASFYQIFDLYVQDEYGVDTMEVVVTTIFMAIGVLPPLFAILPTALCCGPFLSKNSISPGAVLYKSWRWYKLFAGDIPGLIFSFLEGDFLAFSWTAELVADILHGILNYEVLAMGE